MSETNIKNIEANLIEECLILLTHITRKPKDEFGSTPMLKYYESTVESLEKVISVSNALLKHYWEPKF